MLMAEETFLASILFSIPVIWMFFKMWVNHIDLQPPQPIPGSALSQRRCEAESERVANDVLSSLGEVRKEQGHT